MSPHCESFEADYLRVLTRPELSTCRHWHSAFTDKRKDWRFYELIEDTINKEAEHYYLAIVDSDGKVFAIQPCFILDQDILAGVPGSIGAIVNGIRKRWPRFLKLRTLMVGCVAGEGHLDGERALLPRSTAILSAHIVSAARRLNAHMIVLKEFPAIYRQSLGCFLEFGFARVPSMPMTALSLEYASFEDYMARALSRVTRRKLRKKFRDARKGAPIELTIVTDASSLVAEIYPLYAAVYERSKLHFEKLTTQFFREIGLLMPDKVRFFVWRQGGRIVAFALCMLEGDSFYPEYIGLDYRVALDLHLYHYAVRDMISWAITHGYRWFRSSGLNYDPKLHLKYKLGPVDLYVRHTSAVANVVLRVILPWIEPTRYDPTLKKFENYHELWA